MTYLKYTVILLALFLIAATNSQVTIESDSLSVIGKENKAVFEGNVDVTYKTSRLKADKMTVFYNKDKKPEKIECNDNVNFVDGKMYGVSEKAEVDLNTNIIKLIGNVRVWNNDNYLEGEEIIIYNNEERIDIVKKNNKRVKIIFTPDDKDNLIGNKSGKSEKKLQKENGSQ
jgi:lipopolysaccharide export system protein LptA